jgi:hypothetical protein
MTASILVVIIVFGVLFLGAAGFMVSAGIRLKKLRDKLDEDDKK